jgi:hypothetical protein
MLGRQHLSPDSKDGYIRGLTLAGLSAATPGVSLADRRMMISILGRCAAPPAPPLSVSSAAELNPRTQSS